MKKTSKIILILLLALLVIAAMTVAACTPNDPQRGTGGSDTPDGGGQGGGGNQGDDPTHQHTFAQQWSISDAEHWHAATCNHDITADNAAHTLVNNVCSVCGYQNNVDWNDFTFEPDGDGYVLTKYNGTAAHVNIPDVYNDLPVVSIGENAFYHCDSLVSVTIPDSVIIIDGNRNISEGAFYACYNLSAVNFGENSQLDSIGDCAFLDCISLKLITIPDSVTSIGDCAFSECLRLTSIIIPDSVTSIGYYAFGDCLVLTSIIIPDGVTSIGEYVFGECVSLVIYCEAPEQPSVWSLNWNVWDYRESCCPVVWNCKQNNIADDGYEYDVVDGIRYGFKDNEAKVISNNYFGDVTIPSTVEYKDKDYIVKSIRFGAFARCYNLASVIIPDGVTSIGDSAFFGCKNLVRVNTGANSKLENIGRYAFSGCSSITSITIPDGVTSIGDEAFRDCSSLTSIAIPDGVTSIGDSAFFGCKNLVRVNTGANSKLENIGRYAFSDCSSLKSIIIPDSVTSIGSWAFGDCRSLTSIFIPKSVTNMGEMVFGVCSNLTIYCEATTKPSGWESDWNYFGSYDWKDCYCPVVWGATREDAEGR